MKKILLAILSSTMLFASCEKEAVTVTPAPEEERTTVDREEQAAQVTRVNNYMTQLITSLTTTSTVASVASAVMVCPESQVSGDLLHMDFGTFDDPCDIGNGTMIGGPVDLYRGSTGDLLETCPGPYTKGSLVFDELFVAGCNVNVINQNEWDNLYFYAKDDCSYSASGPGQPVEFKFLASPTWRLQFTDGLRLSTINPIISTSGPFVQVTTTVPASGDLFSFEALYNQEYKLHIPHIQNNGINNYYTTLEMQSLPTLQSVGNLGIYTAVNTQLCYRPFASQYITSGVLYAFDLEEPDSDLSVTTYDFGSDENGNDAGEDDAFVKVCYNEKTYPDDAPVQVCKVLECLTF